MEKDNQNLPVIGKTCLVNVIDYAESIPAKVDTGADSSSIWASNVHIDKSGLLHFTLFDKGSTYYTGKEITVEQFSVAQVTSSSGHKQIRYRAQLSIRVDNKRIKTLFNLSDRSNNNFPILIGRRTITNKFLVDVTKGLKIEKIFSTAHLNRELRKNPHAFYKKYHSNNTDK